MAPEDIKPGIEIIVPAGADANRKSPYRLAVDKILARTATGGILVVGTVFRMSGAPSSRQCRAATIDPAKVYLAEEA